MSLTPEQSRAVQAPGDVCVRAGAGTGKTHMLSARYLHLLRAHQLSPLELVATTFTDLAASELRARIRQDIARAEPPFGPEVAAELEAAPILTMHALAARICREHPEAAGVPADFTLLDERPEGAIWALERLDEAIATLPEQVLEQVPPELLRAALEAMLADPLTATDALGCDPARLGPALEAEREALVRRLLETPAWQGSALALARCVGAGDRDLQRRAALGVVQELEAHRLGQPWPDLDPVLTLNLRQGMSKKGWTPEDHAAVTEALKQVRDMLRGASLLVAEPGELDALLEGMQPALREAFEHVSAHLRAAKVAERVLDFGDLEVHALQALADPEVQQYYRLRWRAFLLDEVQDTNPTQERLLAPLVQGAELTIVGDEKQSIYGFRRADVEVFGRLAAGIRARGGDEVNLRASFRTHAPLMQVINQVCGPMLGMLRQDLEGTRPAPHPGPHLEVAHVPEGTGLDVEARRRLEASYLARRLRAWHDAGQLVHDKPSGTLRPMTWGDVAILARTGAPLAGYEEALAAMGIPTALARGADLLGTREAQDGMALLRWLADPGDDLALVAVLRSPCFAIADPVLHRAALGRQGASWWELVQASDHEELRMAASALRQLLDARDEPPGQLLQQLDRLTGYSAVLAGMPGSRRRLADWSGFVALVRSLESGAQDVLTVVRRLRRLINAEVSFERPAIEAGDAVALMTIHASKGLEWPVVIVPNLSASKPADRTRVRFDAELGVALKFKDEEGESLEPLRYQLLKLRAQVREDAEERRIAYVALTRARDRLLLTAPEPPKQTLELVSEGLEAAGIPLEPLTPEPGDERPPQPGLPPAPPWPTRWCEAPLGVGPGELPVTALAEYARCPRAFAFRYVEGHPGIEASTITLPLDAPPELAPPPPVPTPHAHQVGTATHLALELDLADAAELSWRVPELPPELVARALEYAETFRTAPVYAPVRDGLLARERPISLALEGLELRGVVDGVGPDFVLDYKTDREVEPAHHAMQLWAYTRALGMSRGYLAYLRHGQLVALDGPELAAAGEQARNVARAIGRAGYAATPSAAGCGTCAYAVLCKAAVGV